MRGSPVNREPEHAPVVCHLLREDHGGQRERGDPDRIYSEAWFGGEEYAVHRV